MFGNNQILSVKYLTNTYIVKIDILKFDLD